MEFLKRHWWLVATLGAMVVLSVLAVLLVGHFQGQRDRRVTILNRSKSALPAAGDLYSEEAAEKLTRATAYRQEELERIRQYLQRQGNWQVLVPGVLDGMPSDIEVLRFRDLYDVKLAEFIDRLGAIDPEAEGSVPPTEVQMFTSPAVFHRQPWIDQPQRPAEALRLKLIRTSQDDLWLMEDVVEAIRRTNDIGYDAQALATPERTIQHSVIKELDEIAIGVGVLPGRTSQSSATRFLYLGKPQDSGMGGGSGFGQPTATGEQSYPESNERAPTLTGRASNNNGGRFKVLPFRVTVLADASRWPELLRQLSGTRSFITVLDTSVKMVPEIDQGYRQGGLAQPDEATRIRIYGERPLARVTLVCESLIFQIPGARPTVFAQPQNTANTGGGF